MLARLADRLILSPSRSAIDAAGKTCHLVSFDHGQFECWRQTPPSERAVENGRTADPSGGGDAAPDAAPDVVVLKFGGAGGRAERASDHPADAWPDLRVDVWAVNPPGFGGSPGRASIQTFPAVAEAARRFVEQQVGDCPLVVTGNSLGTTAALLLAAGGNVAGIVVRNPPPLRDVIVDRFGWWNLGVGAALIAKQVPETLCAVDNARRASVPAVFISSGRDRIVPPRNQQQVIDAYAGPKQVVRLAEADHGCPLTDNELDCYAESLDWFRQVAIQRHAAT